MYRNLARLAATTAAVIAVVVTAGAPALAAGADPVPLAVNDLPTVIAVRPHRTRSGAFTPANRPPWSAATPAGSTA